MPFKPPPQDEKADGASIFSDRTLCATPEIRIEQALRIPRRVRVAVPPPPRTVGDSESAQAARVHTRSVSAGAFVLWSLAFSLSLVEYLRMLKMRSPAYQTRILLVWIVCGGIFVVVTAAMFTMTVVRRPSVAWLKLLRGVAILMSVASCIIGFGVVFPVIAECSGSKCTRGEHAMRIFVSMSVPAASLWTWVWIFTMGKFVARAGQQ
ncbi:hypothetical protein C8J57DRAFT_1496042 [Mycena rebaudengoi]|nr:hypothetical protein C8J57DRAFT_1496042 [Mycena rebaudengoi]